MRQSGSASAARLPRCLQILGGRQKFDLTPRVTFGEVLSGHHKHVLAEVEQAACRTLEKHMAWKHV